VREEISVSLYGEVQKEVVQTTLAEQFGVEVDFRPTTAICVESVLGVGRAEERIKQGDNPFIAGIGLRVEPGEFGSGIQFGTRSNSARCPSPSTRRSRRPCTPCCAKACTAGRCSTRG
jgi:translation elongation factor EF-G